MTRLRVEGKRNRDSCHLRRRVRVAVREAGDEGVAGAVGLAAEVEKRSQIP